MSRIKGTNTKPELLFREMIDGRVFRYQPKGIQGNPDFANKKRKIALFIDGCFWHKCPRCYREPKSNRKFWIEKIERNVARDRKNTYNLRKNGWTVLRFWEHQIKNNPSRIYAKINNLQSTVR